MPILEGETREGHETLYFHFGSDRALRQGPWKLVSAKLGKWELYNIDSDIGESRDLANAEPARLGRMIDRWQELDSQMAAPLF